MVLMKSANGREMAMINPKEFDQVVGRINALWSVPFDTGKIRVWHQVLGNLKLHRLLRTLDNLSLECEYPPKIAQIVAKYDEIVNQDAAVERRRQIDEQQKLLGDGDLHQCGICNNEGVVFFDRDNYQHMCRCRCGRGKDLNRWSRHQITKGMMVTNPVTQETVSYYVNDVDDALTPEEIGIIQAKNMSRKASIADRADLGNVAQGFLKGIG